MLPVRSQCKAGGGDAQLAGRDVAVQPGRVAEYRQQHLGGAAALLGEAADLEGARVCFLVPPGFDYVAVQWGIWRAGGSEVLTSTFLYILFSSAILWAWFLTGFFFMVSFLGRYRLIIMLTIGFTLMWLAVDSRVSAATWGVTEIFSCAQKG